MTNRFLILMSILVAIGATLVIIRSIRRASHNIRMEIQHMNEDLTGAVSDNTAATNRLADAITNETVQINAALSHIPTEDPAVAAAVAEIQASTSRLDAMTAAVSNIIADEPVPELPAPVEPLSE